MWTEIVEWWKRLTSKKYRMESLKKRRWQRFVKEHATRISYLPTRGGRKAVPAIWDKRVNDWRWVSRGERRRAEQLVGRAMR